MTLAAGPGAKVLLLQLDGKIPNIALMRIAAHHAGDSIDFRRASTPEAVERHLWEHPDKVYASAIFERSRYLADRVVEVFPGALVGGTGVDVSRRLEDFGITTKAQDYSLYPKWRQSIGFTQRGCRLKCPFCVVPRKEGAVTQEQTIAQLWRGDPWPRELILLDNDFFGQPAWRERIAEMRDGGFKVSFNQGINCRMITPEAAAAIASVDYRDDSMKVKRVYTAWDNPGDERRLMAGLHALTDCGVKPDHIMVYMLIGYWPGESEDSWEHRRAKLREFGARPYPMPFNRTKPEVGFQRFVVGAYDKRVTWRDFTAAGYEPRSLP